MPGCDLETLFGNMDEVVEVSQKLLTSLEASTKGKEFSQQIVGEWFTSTSHHSDEELIPAQVCAPGVMCLSPFLLPRFF